MEDESQELMEEIQDGDYIFILDASGNLKSYAVPENIEYMDEMPPNIKKIMKIFKNQTFMQQQTLH